MYKGLIVIEEPPDEIDAAKKPIIVDNSPAQAEPNVQGNYLPDALPGCLVVRKDTPWIIEYYDFEDFGMTNIPDEFPEFLIDPETRILTAVNVKKENYTTFYLTVDCGASDKDGNSLSDGPYFDGSGWHRCRTFVIVLEPLKAVDICYLDNLSEDTMFESDVQPLLIHPDPWTFSDVFLSFPFRDGAYMCTQAVNGSITHYFSASFHAVDFRAPVGTDLLAAADGYIKEIIQNNSVSGIRTSNLFQWNGITLQTDDGLLVEYVHIDTNSATVKEGDRVKAGDVLCKSGNIGFSPEPHLHLEVHRIEDPIGPDVYYGFRAPNGDTFFPIAGQRYGPNGLVELQENHI